MQVKHNLFKYKNIKPNDKADFEKIYKNTQMLIAYMKNNMQQLAAAYKAIEERPSTE